MPPELREALDAAVTQAETSAASEPAQEIQNDHHAQPNDNEGSQQEASSAPEGEVSGTENGTDEPGGDGNVGKSDKPDNVPRTDVDGKTDDEQAAKQAHRVDRAPASWKKEAKGEWAALPLNVRQEIYRREQHINKALSEATPMREAVDQFNQVVSPYMARIQQHNVTPMQAINSLLSTDYKLATAHPRDAAQLMAQLINNYNIDISALDEALSSMKGGQQSRQAADPQADLVNQIRQSLLQELSPVLQTVQTFQQQQTQQQQAVQAEINNTIEQMSLNPEFPHFDAVRDTMADVMEVAARRGVYMTLEDAYAHAIGLDPNVAGQVVQQQQRGIASGAHQRAQAAKAAASSVQSRPGFAGNAAPNTDGSLRGALEAAFSGSGGRI